MPAKRARRPSHADISKQRLRLWLRMLRATRTVEAGLRERLRVSHGTTLPRFDVMAALYRAQAGLKMSELSRMLMVSNGNVTGIIDRLVADGLIVRVAIEGDRRATLVRLTRRGRDEFANMAAEHEAWVNDILGPLDETDVEMASALLEKLKPELKPKENTP